MAHDAQQLAKGAPSVALGNNWRAYEARAAAQIALRDTMDRWAGRLHVAGWPDHQIQRHFWLSYGVDVLSAQALGAKDADTLRLAIDRAVNSG